MPFHLSWFPFYHKDFFGSGHVRFMTREQKCIYLELLCIQWEEGSLPMDERQLAAALHIDQKKFDEVWPEIGVCFIELKKGERKGRLINPRLEDEREHAKDNFKKKQAWSSMAHQAKRRKIANSNANSMLVAGYRHAPLPEEPPRDQIGYPEADEMENDNHKPPP